ncbi:MAG: hypothetical protein AMXMBFR80_28350 [Dehalococcoidia bacterium]
MFELGDVQWRHLALAFAFGAFGALGALAAVAIPFAVAPAALAALACLGTFAGAPLALFARGALFAGLGFIAGAFVAAELALLGLLRLLLSGLVAGFAAEGAAGRLLRRGGFLGWRGRAGVRTVRGGGRGNVHDIALGWSGFRAAGAAAGGGRRSRGLGCAGFAGGGGQFVEVSFLQGSYRVRACCARGRVGQCGRMG